MADFFTYLNASGTQSELTSMLQVILKYSCEARKQYHESRDCWYFDADEADLLPQERIHETKDAYTLELSLQGPYGVVHDPFSDYNVFFTELADAAPMAQFNAQIEGFDVGGNLCASAILREGKLYTGTDYSNFENEDFTDVQNSSVSGKHVLSGLTFVITGKLKEFKNRDALLAFIQDCGGRTTSGVSQRTSFLINNDKQSNTAKNIKAKDLGIPIISEKEFLDQFNLTYHPCNSHNEKLYEAGYYDPIQHVFYPPRKLKREPLTIQIIFECTDHHRPAIQLDLDVDDYMGMSCSPDDILSCKSIDSLENLLLSSITDKYSYLKNGNDFCDKWRREEFRALLLEKWEPVKKSIESFDSIERIILRRIDARFSNRLLRWAPHFHKDLIPLAHNIVLGRQSQKMKDIASFKKYLDELDIWYPWNDSEPDWPSLFCGFKEEARVDWRSLTDDIELFARMVVTGDIGDLDHGEEITAVNFKTQTFTQAATLFPGW